MAEYIERKALLKAMDMRGRRFFPQNGEPDFETPYIMAKSVYDTIGDIPAANVKTVVNGRWKSIGLSSLECSECGYQDDWKMYHRYCPDCGVFMR